MKQVFMSYIFASQVRTGEIILDAKRVKGKSLNTEGTGVHRGAALRLGLAD